MKKSGIIIVLCALLLLVGLNSFYTVEENQFACTVRFSEIISTTDTAGSGNIDMMLPLESFVPNTNGGN